MEKEALQIRCDACGGILFRAFLFLFPGGQKKILFMCEKDGARKEIEIQEYNNN